MIGWWWWWGTPAVCQPWTKGEWLRRPTRSDSFPAPRTAIRAWPHCEGRTSTVVYFLRGLAPKKIIFMDSLIKRDFSVVWRWASSHHCKYEAPIQNAESSPIGKRDFACGNTSLSVWTKKLRFLAEVFDMISGDSQRVPKDSCAKVWKLPEQGSSLIQTSGKNDLILHTAKRTSQDHWCAKCKQKGTETWELKSGSQCSDSRWLTLDDSMIDSLPVDGWQTVSSGWAHRLFTNNNDFLYRY